MPIEEMFFIFPRLETERLVLRQIRADDADALFAFFSDEEVSSKRHRSVEESQAFIQQLQHWYQAHENLEWGITRKGDDVLLGTCGFYAFDEGFQRAETGYELRKRVLATRDYERGAHRDPDLCLYDDGAAPHRSGRR